MPFLNWYCQPSPQRPQKQALAVLQKSCSLTKIKKLSDAYLYVES